jgi:hypothetical protein
MSKYKISYNGWSDEASPIKSDVKVKTSHNRLVSQKQNALARGEWGRKNPNKSHEIAKKGGEANTTDETRERCSNLGKTYGKDNVVKYIPIETKKRNGKKYGKQNLVGEIVCEKCGRKTNKGNYKQFHGTKCREKDKIKILKKLPNKFTKGMLKEVAEKMEIMDWNKLNLLHPTCPYTKCIIKVEKPNQYNPCWYGKNLREINKIK